MHARLCLPPPLFFPSIHPQVRIRWPRPSKYRKNAGAFSLLLIFPSAPDISSHCSVYYKNQEGVRVIINRSYLNIGEIGKFSKQFHLMATDTTREVAPLNFGEIVKSFSAQTHELHEHELKYIHFLLFLRIMCVGGNNSLAVFKAIYGYSPRVFYVQYVGFFVLFIQETKQEKILALSFGL